jgi:hypothetical protein
MSEQTSRSSDRPTPFMLARAIIGWSNRASGKPAGPFADIEVMGACRDCGCKGLLDIREDDE